MTHNDVLYPLFPLSLTLFLSQLHILDTKDTSTDLIQAKLCNPQAKPELLGPLHAEV